ncbi:MAG: S41 family peptidase [Gemmatimonadota bacterium]
MSFTKRTILPFTLVGASIFLGGWFLQEGVSREENVFVQVRLFQEVVDHVAEQYVDPVERDALYDSAIEGVLRELDDPNSSFIRASDYEDFRIRATDGDYGGVGLEVLARDGFVTVMTVIPGGPGARAGIRAGDRFYRIGGEDAEGWAVERAVDLLRGEPDSEIEVEMLRPGVDEPIPFVLRRAVIQLKSVPFTAVLDDGVGYVPLQVFRTTSSDEVAEAVQALESQGVRAVVLDLRDNPGGLLDEGIDVSELFLDAGAAIVETRGRGTGQSRSYSAQGGPAFPELPLVVLVDETSASASEIVAGALQDHDRALLVGAPSYGKGSVQSLFRLSGGNVLRLTTALWYTPVGRSIQKERDREPDELPHGALTLDGSLVATDDPSDRPEFQSEGGRTLLGGGGITPDLWVVQDTLTTLESAAVRALYQEAGLFTRTVFNFAVSHVQTAEPTPGFRVTDTLVDRFLSALREAGLELDDDTLAQADRYIRYQLESEIALQAFGEEGRFLRLLDQDRQLQAALRALQEASSTQSLVAQGAEPVSRAVPLGG